MINKAELEITKAWPKQWDSPMVSIRCLAYNHARYIESALDGFLMQETSFPFEIVIHDDASTDGTADIIREYEKKYPNIVKPIYESENQYSKQNGAIRRIVNDACKGKYFAFCEGDDYWISKEKLQKQIDILEQDCSVFLVHTGFETVDEKNCQIERLEYESFQRLSLKENGLVSLFKNNHIMTLSIVIRREVVFSELYLNSPYKYDYALFFSAAFMGKIKYIPTKMGAYRKNPSSVMQNKFAEINEKLRVLYCYFANYYVSHPGLLSVYCNVQIDFWIMVHLITYKNFSFLSKMLKKKPLRLVVFFFSYMYCCLASVKKCYKHVAVLLYFPQMLIQ
jgi:glycosyltransferase involved in cell wall biosynthesis